MVRIYGSDLCPDCVACKNSFDANGVEYEMINITAGMRELKAFLKLRDTDPVFTEVKQNGSVGIPALVTDAGGITLDWEGYLRGTGINPEPPAETGSACQIDGTGC